MFISLSALVMIVALISGAFLSVYTKKLTVSAAITGLICGLIIGFAAGYGGLIFLAAFFISGTLATAWGKRVKKRIEKSRESSARKYMQVLANGGTATLMALLILIFPSHHVVLTVMLAASLASATSDTLSSELGMLYGKRCYNCISWKKDTCGLDGVVSLEGTLIGIMGAAFIGGIYFMMMEQDYGLQITINNFIIITIAGIAGNLSDSVLGAALERRKIIGNDVVNFLSTLFAAVVAGGVFCFF